MQNDAQSSRPVALRDTGNTETVHQGMPEQRSFGASLGAVCTRLWPARHAAHEATAAGAVDNECGRRPQDIAEITDLAGQDAAEILRAKQVSRRQQSTSVSGDVFNLFDDSLDASNQTANPV